MSQYIALKINQKRSRRAARRKGAQKTPRLDQDHHDATTFETLQGQADSQHRQLETGRNIPHQHGAIEGIQKIPGGAFIGFPDVFTFDLVFI